MRTAAYLNSPGNPEGERQQETAILDFARRKNIDIDRIISANVRPNTSNGGRERNELLGQLGPGDRLIVSELGCMGRSLGEIATTVDELLEKKVMILAIREGISLGGSRDLRTEAVRDAIRLFAEIHRDLVSKRVREGQAAANSSGRKPGRPKGALGKSKLDGREDEIRKLLALGVSKASIAKITGVNRGVLYHFIKSRRLLVRPRTEVIQ